MGTKTSIKPGRPPQAAFSVEHYAVMVGASPRTICRLCEQGRLPAFKVGRAWRIPASVIENQLLGAFQ